MDFDARLGFGGAEIEQGWAADFVALFDAAADRIRAQAVVLYEVGGETPKAIVGRLAERDKDPIVVPLDTVKGWVRGLKRGTGQEATGRERWDFMKATPEERRLIAPLFALSDDGSHPLLMWPSREVGDWFVRIRQLVPDHPAREVWMSARYLTTLQRRIEDGTGSRDDELSYDMEIAEWLDAAGSQQSTDVAITVDLPQNVESAGE